MVVILIACLPVGMKGRAGETPEKPHVCAQVYALPSSGMYKYMYMYMYCRYSILTSAHIG